MDRIIESADVVSFIKEHPTPPVTQLERSAGLAKATLAHAVRGVRELNNRHILKLLPILNQVGFQDFLNTKYNKAMVQKPTGQHQAKVIAIINNKGGVGKTTVTINLGAALNKLGHKVLLVDMDSQGNLSQCLGFRDIDKHIGNALVPTEKGELIDLSRIIQPVVGKTNMDIAPSDLRVTTTEKTLSSDLNGAVRLRKALKPILPNYDYVLIDCPPSLTILTSSGLAAANAALIVVEPERSAIEGLRNMLNLVQEMQDFINPSLSIGGVVISRVNKQILVHRTLIESIQDEFKSLHQFKTQIHLMTVLKESQVAQEDVFSYKQSSESAKEFLALGKEFELAIPVN